MRQTQMLNKKLQQLDYRFRQGWTWWCEQIQGLSPPFIQKLLGSTQQHTLLLQDEYGLQWLHPPGMNNRARLASDATPAQQADFVNQLPSKKVTLLLPESQLLRLSLQIAQEAVPHLDAVLRHQLPLLTPFQREQVYVCHLPVGQASGKTVLELIVLPRSQIDETLAALAQLKLDVTQLRPFSDANRSDCNLLPPRRPQHSLPTRLTRMLIPINILLLATVIALPLWQQQQQISELQQQRDSVRQEAAEVYRVRQALEQIELIQQQLYQQQNRPTSSLQLLATLSNQLSDQAWINQFEWQDARLHLKGEASDASSLISVLDSVPAFSNVRFSSPVTRNPDSNKERFSIEIELNGEQTL